MCLLKYSFLALLSVSRNKSINYIACVIMVPYL